LELLRKLTDKDFGGTNEISYTNPSINVRAVLLDENNNIALMCMPKFKHNNLNDSYVLPGGEVDSDENLEEALKREIFEETGCHFSIIEELGYFEENCAKDNFSRNTYYYLIKIVGEKGRPQMTESEIENQAEIQWHSLEKALDIITNQIVFDNNMWLVYLKFRDEIIISETVKYLCKCK